MLRLWISISLLITLSSTMTLAFAGGAHGGGHGAGHASGHASGAHGEGGGGHGIGHGVGEGSGHSFGHVTELSSSDTASHNLLYGRFLTTARGANNSSSSDDDKWKQLATSRALADLHIENKSLFRVILNRFNQADPTFDYKIQISLCLEVECATLDEASGTFSHDNELTLIQKISVSNIGEIAAFTSDPSLLRVQVTLLNGNDEELSYNFVKLTDIVKSRMVVPLNRDKTRSVILDFL